MKQHFLFQEHLFVDREKKLNGFDKLLRPETIQAVMLVEAEEKMGKSWLAAKMHLLCASKHEGMPLVYLDFENPLDKGRITDHLAFVRLLRNRIGYAEFFTSLNQTINRLTMTQSVATATSPLAALTEEIQSSYTPSALERMARFLNVDWENLAGNTHFNRTFSFVRDLYQRNHMELLFNRLRQERSHIDWTRHIQAIQAAQGAADPYSAPEEEAVDQGKYLAASSEKEMERAEQQINEAFFDSLAGLIAAKGQLVFLFDTVDEAPAVAQRLITEQLVPHLLDERLKDMVIVITGRRIPDLSRFNIDHLLVRTGLEPFSEEHIRTFMDVRSIREDPPDFTWKGLLRLSGGVPGELALMADRLTASTSKHDPFFDD
jgi:hypothetical protein